MNVERLKALVRGAVQGVGFRPFVYRLATELRLNGWVMNSTQGVRLEVEGGRTALDQFLFRLETEKPPRAVIQGLEHSFLDATGFDGFEIRESRDDGDKTAFILPDIATCADCLRELFDPGDRRFRYPFINCTHCGPRFSIIEALPYDRRNTSMKRFAFCAECEREYHDPRDRRFHAQPNACPKCGPQLALWDARGVALAARDEALLRAADAIRKGRIVALKAIGGFQLLVDARNESAVNRLRERKQREEKPFALLYPSLEMVRRDCRVSRAEERLLLSPEAPIVLLERTGLESVVAPGNPTFGVMLPSTPLHHLLMRELNFPIVATSGNQANEPICITEAEALARLREIADVFLVHDRPIVRHVDDSVARIVLDRELVLRRARGYAPLPIQLKSPLPNNLLAAGAHLKNTVALGVRDQVFVSQHIGDLETKEAYGAFLKVLQDFQQLYEVTPEGVARDLHPDYLSSKFAARSGLPDTAVQHHYAHVLACMAENELDAPVLGVAWDGTGCGLDGTIWGGEFLLVTENDFRRVAHLHPFKLPGGEMCMRQPRRSALGVLHEVFGDELFERADLVPLRHFTGSELRMLRQMLAREINSPITSSAGRLFDAVASLVGLRQRASFEGQAAMELEFAVADGTGEHYPFELEGTVTGGIDWRPMMVGIIKEVQRGESVGIIAAKFHNTLAEMMVAVARAKGQAHVVLSGGCFQNRQLLERAVRRLRAAGFQPCWHQRIPPNDGGIALGQVIAAARALRHDKEKERQSTCVSQSPAR